MKKGKRILVVVLVLAVLAIGAALIYFYPAWRAAEILQEKMESNRFSYEIEIELDKGQLSEAQVGMFRVLAKLLGMDEDTMYSYVVKGRMWSGRIYVLVYLKNVEEPLVEFYMGEDGIALNEAMVYNTIRNGLVERYGALGRLIPEQKGNLYISLEQVEQMFGVKLWDICEFAFPSMDAGLTAGQYFVMLATVSREKIEDGNRFEIVKERTKVQLDVSGAGESSAVELQLDMQEPAETLSEAEWLLSKMEIRLPIERLRMLKTFSLTVAAGEGAEITMPTDYVKQGTVDLISEIRKLIEKILDMQADSEDIVI